MLPKISKWATLSRVLLFCISCTVALVVTSGLTKSLPRPWDTFASLSAALMITICLTYIFSRWERISFKDIGLVPVKYSVSRILLGFAIGFIIASLQPLLLLLFSSHIRLESPGQFLLTPVVTSFFIYVLVAVREEIAFRAYPLRSLDKVLGPWLALLIIFIIFSVEHILGGMSWWQGFMGAGVGSLLFGIAALSTKGLAMPVGLHIAWNFGQWAYGFKDNTGLWRAVIDKGYEGQVENQGFVAYLVVMVFAIAGFYWYWTSSVNRNKQPG